MALEKFELDSNGVRQLLQSAEVRDVCERAAGQALRTLGSGYTTDTRTGRNRIRVEVRADTPEAKRENRKNNSVLKAVGGVKL